MRLLLVATCCVYHMDITRTMLGPNNSIASAALTCDIVLIRFVSRSVNRHHAKRKNVKCIHINGKWKPLQHKMNGKIMRDSKSTRRKKNSSKSALAFNTLFALGIQLHINIIFNAIWFYMSRNAQIIRRFFLSSSMLQTMTNTHIEVRQNS